MTLGILETKSTHVPGTSLLERAEAIDNESYGVVIDQLKREPGTGIILVPQPSDDPEDPLNWSRWKKERFTIAYAFGCGCVGAVGPLLGPAFVELSEQFEVSLTLWNIGIQGVLIAMIGVGSLILNVVAVKYGKRPVYLSTTLILAVTCFWAAGAQSLASLIASRVVMGFCMGPFEALVPASIADVWFVHERGHRSAIFNLGVLGGINLATPISGSIIQYAGFRSAFWIMGAFFVLSTILVFFWMPETAFRMSSEVAQSSGCATENGPETVMKAGHGAELVHAEAGTGLHGQPSPSPSKSRWTQYKPYSGYNNDIPFFTTLVRPFAMLLSPAVIWATVLFTTGISWLVGIAITLAQIFSAPPYEFSVSAIGAANLSAFVASVIGMGVARPLIDSTVRLLSRKNNGVFEPEFRLPIMASYLMFTAVGFFAWGQAGYAKDPWPVPVIVCLGLINLGIQLSVTGLVTYVVDCHRERAGEAFGAMNFIKNMFAFSLTFFLNDWLETDGIRNTFFIIGGITAACALTTIPMYVFGKKARDWVHRNGVIGQRTTELI